MTRVFALVVMVTASLGCRDRAEPEPAPRAPDPAPPAPAPSPPPPPVAPTGLPCLADAERLAVPGGTISSLAAGDLDRDGAPDLVLVNDRWGLDDDPGGDGEQMLVLRNDGAGQLAVGERVDADPGTLTITLGDIDRDGALDAVTGTVRFDGTMRATLHVHLGRGDGRFASAWTGSITRESSADAIADVTGDGVLDLVVTAPNHVDVYATDGRHAPTRTTRLRAGRYPQSVRPVDLDGDGDLDLAFLNHVSYELMIAVNRGRGAFAPPTAIETCTSPSELAIADFDRDGKLDAMVSCLGMRLVDGKVLAPAYLGIVADVAAPQPTFVPLAVPPVHDFAVLDLDADGALDVVGAREVSQTFDIKSRVSVLRGDGRGKLVEEDAVEVPGQVSGVTAVDLDRDGRIDLVMPMWTGREPFVLVWRGRACPPPPPVKTT